MSRNISCLPRRHGILGGNTKNTLQWKATIQFNPVITKHPEYDSEYGIMSNSISYSYLFQFDNDDSNLMQY